MHIVYANKMLLTDENIVITSTVIASALININNEREMIHENDLMTAS